MGQFTIMCYNVQHMNRMFEGNRVKPGETDRAEKIAAVISDIGPHVLGICEAANTPKEHAHFIQSHLSGMGYRTAQGVSRGGQNLVFYYRDPFAVVAVDEAFSYYEPWDEDVDEDGLRERHHWERKPLEVLFEIGAGGPRLRVILVHTKSKVVFSVVDLYSFQKISAANRKRLVAQAARLRQRLDQLLDQPQPVPFVVMGDMNDGPGLDPYERMVGRSFVETLMGSLYEPHRILHNVLWWMSMDSASKKQLWTADFPDPIVNHPRRARHRVWIDHILLSPSMLQPAASVRYVMNSGGIGAKTKDAEKASDHFPVFARVEID